MDLSAVKEVLTDGTLRAVFQAAILVVYEETDITAQELASQLGISRATLFRFLRREREKPRYVPVLPIGAELAPCNHRALYTGSGRRICLRCLMSNFEADPLLRRDPRTDPKPEPRKVYRPGKYKGGKGK